MRAILIFLVKGYRLLISPLLPPSCRFYPTCSEYAIEALGRHGAFKGGWLTLRRLSRCHPFCKGGVDPVPGDAPAGADCCPTHRATEPPDSCTGAPAVQSRD